MRDFLLTGFDYDLWANRTWEGKLQAIPDAAPVFEVLTHLLRSQRGWAERCGVEGLPKMSENLDVLFVTYHDAWRGMIIHRDLDSLIRYLDEEGAEVERPLGEIAWHLVTHGCYHRGQIREIVEAQGMKHWPDTDMLDFFDEMRRS